MNGYFYFSWMHTCVYGARLYVFLIEQNFIKEKEEPAMDIISLIDFPMIVDGDLYWYVEKIMIRLSLKWNFYWILKFYVLDLLSLRN